MVRGNGSARAKKEVKTTATPKTTRIRMRRRRLRDTLKKDLSIFWLAMRSGMEPMEIGDQTFRALSSQSVMASASNGFRSRHTAPLAAALDSRPESVSAVVMITGKREP